MKGVLKRLWNEYLADECAMFSSEEERALSKKAAQIHDDLYKGLTKEQAKALEEFADSINDLNSYFAQKAFIKGCEFSALFVFETFISGR